MYRAASLVVMALFAIPALGDVVYLKNGGVLEGEVVPRDDSVVVKLPAGEVTVTKDAVDRIEKKESVLGEYEKRAAQLKADDAAGQLQLALWAQSKGLKPQAKALLQTVLALDPNNAQARQALGYRLINGQWMTEDEEMQARGLIRYDGQWVTVEAAAKLRELKAQLDVAREQRRAAEAELQQAREELKTPAQPAEMPAYGYNPYDQYYATRELYNRRYSYPPYGGSYSSYSYYSVPAYPLPVYYGLWGAWWSYPGGRRFIPRSHR